MRNGVCTNEIYTSFGSTEQNREIKVRTAVYCSTQLQLILLWKKFMFFRFVPK